MISTTISDSMLALTHLPQEKITFSASCSSRRQTITFSNVSASSFLTTSAKSSK